MYYREVNTNDRLPAFAGLYIAKVNGHFTEAFFKHYALEGTWREHVEIWLEPIKNID